MRSVIQRVASASVRVRDELVGEIGRGLLVLLAIGAGDDGATAERLATRVATLRVFPDGSGRMNLDVRQAGGSVLVVSQFTLYADTSRGHRPSFSAAAPPEIARPLCAAFAATLERQGIATAAGRFGEAMEVDLVNDGPVTLVLSAGEGPWLADAG